MKKAIGNPTTRTKKKRMFAAYRNFATKRMTGPYAQIQSR